MTFLDRFSGRVAPDFDRGPPSAAILADPPGLQLLFGAGTLPRAEHLAAVLRGYHADLAAASVELLPVGEVPGSEKIVSQDGPPAATLGLIAWGRHAIKLVAFDAPMPSSAIEACLRAALLPPEVKADARAHTSHVLLYYAGFEPAPREQFVALAAVAGALAEFGAIVTLHEEARVAILSTDLLPDDDAEDMLTILRNLPLPYLYGGFAKLVLSDRPGVWMRTFANHRFNLPNLAYFAASHDEGQAIFRLFSGLAGYLLETGFVLEPGEAIRIDDDAAYQVREPRPEEWWLDGPGAMWVVEPSSSVDESRVRS